MSFKALETGILERPTRKRRRRNSDSNLYCKARGEEIEESEKEPEQTLRGGTQLEFERRRFVERYLENIHETRSMTTDTSDSGVRTHGAPSDFEMQEITGKYSLSFSFISVSKMGGGGGEKITEDIYRSTTKHRVT